MTSAPPSVWAARVGAVVLLIVYGTPLLWLLTTSFKTSPDVFRGVAGLFLFTPGLHAYERIWNLGVVHAGLNSTIIAAGTTALTLTLAVPAAYALARLRGSIVQVGLALIIVLQMMPQTASVIPLYKVLGAWGLLGSVLGVVMADAALLLPFCILLLRPFFLAVPKAIEEAGTVDGASRWRVFGQIVLPLTLNGVATAATIIFVIAWGEFLYGISLLVDPTQYPLSVLIASQIGQYGTDWPAMMALAVSASLPILVVFLFTYRLLREGLALGSFK